MKVAVVPNVSPIKPKPTEFDAQRSPLFDVRAPDVSIVLAVRNWTLISDC